MGPRFTYSRWDGTQQGFDLDADALLGEITDDLLYHGDVNAALRRLMQEGMNDRDGRRIEGMRDLMRRLRDRRALPFAAVAAVRASIADVRARAGGWATITAQLDGITGGFRVAVRGSQRFSALSAGPARSAPTPVSV